MKNIFTLATALVLLFCTAGSIAQKPLLQWQTEFGGSSFELCKDVRPTADSGFIMAGIAFSADGDVTGSHGYNDAWIVKTDRLGNIQWKKCYGGNKNDAAYSIRQTTDGGYIFAGSSESKDGDAVGGTGGPDNPACWLVKIDGEGTVEWQKTYATQVSGLSVIPTNDNGYIIGGNTIAEGSAYVLKTDAAGALQWHKYLQDTIYIAATASYIGNPIVGGSFAGDISQTADGGYAFAGSAGIASERDFWVVKLNDVGDVSWKKTYGPIVWDEYTEQTAKLEVYGGTLQQTPDGGFIVAGSGYGIFNDTLPPNGGSNGMDYHIMKLDAAGSILWQKNYGGSGSDNANDVQLTKDGGYIVSGYSPSDDGDVVGGNGTFEEPASWVINLDTDGNLKWQKSLSKIEGFGSRIRQTQEGAYIVQGSIYTDAKAWEYWMAKLTDSVYKPFSSDTIRQCNSGVLLNAGANYRTYKWGNDSVSQVLKVDSTGFYAVTVTNSFGSVFSDSVFVIINYPLIGRKIGTSANLVTNNYSSVCGNSTKLYTNAAASETVKWSTGTTAATITVAPNKNTVYFADIRYANQTCRDSITNTVTPIAYDALPDTSILCSLTDSVILKAGTGFAQYSWTSGQTTDSIIIKTVGNYAVKVKKSNDCMAGDSSFVRLFDREKTDKYIFNGDGKYSLAANWLNNRKPPATLPVGSEIIISPKPGGVCILDVLQRLSDCSFFRITDLCNLVISGDLIIK
jgi:hypothetical protein